MKDKIILIAILLIWIAPISAQTYWWNDAVFYEVFVRSFKDSDGNGNGDIQGLISKLDYLNDGDTATHNDLGITALWLMPIQQSPSYHGYDVTDYRTIEQDYGTNADFQQLMTEAHKRGIKVIIDLVMNHTSSQHPWFVESMNPSMPKRSWYTYTNPKPSYNGPWNQNVWHLRNGYYNYGIFWSEMPDLNYSTQEVKDEMFDVARFWLEDMNVDGFRLDAIKYIFETNVTTTGSQMLEDTPETIQFWQDFRAYYKTIEDSALAVGEAWTSTDKVAPYVNNNGLDFCFEFDLAESIIGAANASSNAALKAQMEEVVAAYPAHQYGNFLTNHDMNRVMNRFSGSVAKAKLGADLLLTLPGIPFLYYGEEIGMTGVKPDENIRTPMQWTNAAQAGFSSGTPWRAVNADYTTKNVESQQYDSLSLWHHYRKLLAIRNDQAALRKGNWASVTSSNASAFSFLRQHGVENILVVSNTSSSQISGVQLSMTQSGIAAGTYSLVELQGGAMLSLTVDGNGDFTLNAGDISARTTLMYKLMNPANTTTSVTFRVDMNALISASDFYPGTETVDIVGSFNGYGSSLTILSDADQDGIYTVTISNLPVGAKLRYKYRINGVNNGREEYSNSTYFRQHLTLEKPGATADVYQKLYITTTRSGVFSAVSVYPVPAEKVVYVEYGEALKGSIGYSLLDAVGHTVGSGEFFANASEGVWNMNCEGLKPGVYQLILRAEAVQEVKRIIVQ